MMTTDTQSNSKFYHGDCLCEKEIHTSIIAIQCSHCITDDPLRHQYNSRGYECDCKDVKIKHMVCNKCGDLRDKIDTLNYELDKLTYDMVYEIKMYMNCEYKLERIKDISNELRHLNRMLLENLVRKEVNRVKRS
jgi:hypothetical protein